MWSWTTWHLGLWFALGAVIGGALGACSFGDAITPNCDPDADPEAANACHQVSYCDDGNGFVKPEESCCIAYGNVFFESCTGTFLSRDGDNDKNYQDECENPATQAIEACCGSTTVEYDNCLLGMMTASGGGGTGGTGGSTGGTTMGGGGSGG